MPEPFDRRAIEARETNGANNFRPLVQIKSPGQPRWIGAAYNTESCGYVVGMVPSPGALGFDQQPGEIWPQGSGAVAINLFKIAMVTG
jgi:hypothetical protein